MKKNDLVQLLVHSFVYKDTIEEENLVVFQPLNIPDEAANVNHHINIKSLFRFPIDFVRNFGVKSELDLLDLFDVTFLVCGVGADYCLILHQATDYYLQIPTKYLKKIGTYSKQ